MRRDFSKTDECIYPYEWGCRYCEHSRAPELFDGGCELIVPNEVLERSVDVEYIEQVIKTFRNEFWGLGVTDETFRKVMEVMKLARHTLIVKGEEE